MSEDNVATINGVGIKDGDIVFIKFKPLSEVLEFYRKENWTASQFLSESSIDYHLSALLNPGYYKIEDIHINGHSRNFPQTKAMKRLDHKKQPHEISIDNHNSEDSDCFTFNEHIVEEIRVEHDAADSYFSDKFQLSLMKIDGALYINNERVTKRDGKLIDILENTISDLAIQRMLEDSKDEDKDK